MMDSTVVVRYGKKQAGAERGYNPKKRGRPSHHPLVAYVRETGDCLGVRWRAGGAHTAEGAKAWLETLVGRLRGAGVRDITVRLDKGFFSRDMVRMLDRLGVSFLLKVPRHRWLSALRSDWRLSARGDAVLRGWAGGSGRAAEGAAGGVRGMGCGPRAGHEVAAIGPHPTNHRCRKATNDRATLEIPGKGNHRTRGFSPPSSLGAIAFRLLPEGV